MLREKVVFVQSGKVLDRRVNGSLKLGQYIRERRKELNLTQTDLANALHNYPGVRQYGYTAVKGWERGYAMPPMDDPAFVRALADILKVSEAEILRVVGFAIADSSAPDTLPPEFLALLEKATPEQLEAIGRVAQLMVAQQNAKPKK